MTWLSGFPLRGSCVAFDSWGDFANRAPQWQLQSSRLRDLSLVLDTLEGWNEEDDLFAGRLTLWFLNRYLRDDPDQMPTLADYPRIVNFKQK